MESQRSFLFYHWRKYAPCITQPFHPFTYRGNSGKKVVDLFFPLVFHEQKAFKTKKLQRAHLPCESKARLLYRVHENPALLPVGYRSIGQTFLFSFSIAFAATAVQKLGGPVKWSEEFAYPFISLHGSRSLCDVGISAEEICGHAFRLLS